MHFFSHPGTQEASARLMPKNVPSMMPTKMHPTPSVVTSGPSLAMPPAVRLRSMPMTISISHTHGEEQQEKRT